MKKKQKKQPKQVNRKTAELTTKSKFDIKNFILNQTMSIAFKKILDNFDWDTFIAFIASFIN